MKNSETGARSAIGGEFETDHLILGKASALDQLTHGLEGAWKWSGRSALYQVLRHLKEKGVSRIHLPAFLCDSIMLPVKTLGLDYSFYPVDETLTAQPDPSNNDAVLIIHYFGRINPAVHELRKGSGTTHHLIEDACQALLTDWTSGNCDGIHYLLSPRKFGPVPLGGWCNLPEMAVEQSAAATNRASLSMVARFVKAAYLADTTANVETETEKFYLEAFEQTENALDELSTSGLPEWMLKIIAGVDWSVVARSRVQNQRFLISELSELFEFPIPHFGENEVPLGQPLLVEDRDGLREALARNRIFCPIHWHLPSEVAAARFPQEHGLSSHLMTIPIDQRYDTSRLSQLVEIIKSLH
jgi:hypothetical protein